MDNGRLYYSTETNVNAISLASGQQVWSTQVAVSRFTSLAVANNLVYLGTFGGDAVALDANTGTQRWRNTIAQLKMVYPPAVVNGVVYIGARSGPVFALDAATGATLWSYNNAYGFDTYPVVANGQLFVGSPDGSIYAFGLSGSLNANAAPRVDPKTLHPNLRLRPPAGQRG